MPTVIKGQPTSAKVIGRLAALNEPVALSFFRKQWGREGEHAAPTFRLRGVLFSPRDFSPSRGALEAAKKYE